MSSCNGTSDGGTSMDGVIGRIIDAGNLEGGTVLQPGRLPLIGYSQFLDGILSGVTLSAFKIHLVSILIGCSIQQTDSRFRAQ
jgi:hypothetical protein